MKSMTSNSNKIILKRIREAAEKIKGRLPDHLNHPDGRNPYAHIPKVIIDLLGESYKTLPDDKFDDVMTIIDYCEENLF